MIFPRRCDTCRRYKEQLKNKREINRSLANANHDYSEKIKDLEKLLAEKDKQLEGARPLIESFKILAGGFSTSDSAFSLITSEESMRGANICIEKANKWLEQFKESE